MFLQSIIQRHGTWYIPMMNEKKLIDFNNGRLEEDRKLENPDQPFSRVDEKKTESPNTDMLLLSDLLLITHHYIQSNSKTS